MNILKYFLISQIHACLLLGSIIQFTLGQMHVEFQRELPSSAQLALWPVYTVATVTLPESETSLQRNLMKDSWLLSFPYPFAEHSVNEGDNAGREVTNVASRFQPFRIRKWHPIWYAWLVQP